jgi:serine/threonine protein kinase
MEHQLDSVSISNNHQYNGCVPGLDEYGELLDLEFQGSGGTVYKVPYGDELCIVKIPNMFCYNDDISLVEAEISILQDEELQQEPIAKLKAVHSWKSEAENMKIAFVFKFYPGGDLMTLLTQTHENRDPRLIGPSVELDFAVLRVVQRLCSILAKLHNKGWCHCDIKPENIFCPSADYYGLQACVLGDFGGIKRIGVDFVIPNRTGTANWVPWKDGRRLAHGSFDIYSVGKIMHAMKLAFGPLSPEVTALANKLMSRASDRPSASDVLQNNLPQLFCRLKQQMCLHRHE